MGLYDESWCVDCGKSQPYSPDDVVCGDCTSEAYESRSVKLIEYMKLHLISLDQDSEKIWNAMDQIDDLESDEYEELNIQDIRNGGEIAATRHLLSLASDILGIQLEEK
jgi:NMD protein affecting ribosome stability and mRNA decay